MVKSVILFQGWESVCNLTYKFGHQSNMFPSNIIELVIILVSNIAFISEVSFCPKKLYGHSGHCVKITLYITLYQA